MLGGHKGAYGPGNQQADMPTLGPVRPQVSRGVLCTGCSPQWNQVPWLQLQTLIQSSTPETQTRPALDVTAPLQVSKVDKEKVLLHHTP